MTPAEKRLYNAVHMRQHRDRLRKSGRCVKCGKKATKWNCRRCRDEENARSRLERLDLRNAALQAYGNECYCCGERRKEFLGIDHVKGGGTKHRAKLRLAGAQFYRWLKKKKYPKKKFRVACHNCNLSVGFYGYCPHKRAT